MTQNTSPEAILEMDRLQKEIAGYIGGIEQNSLLFEYVQKDTGKTRLDLITVNPRHRQSFLFHSTE